MKRCFFLVVLQVIPYLPNAVSSFCGSDSDDGYSMYVWTQGKSEIAFHTGKLHYSKMVLAFEMTSG